MLAMICELPCSFLPCSYDKEVLCATLLSASPTAYKSSIDAYCPSVDPDLSMEMDAPALFSSGWFSANIYLTVILVSGLLATFLLCLICGRKTFQKIKKQCATVEKGKDGVSIIGKPMDHYGDIIVY